MTQTTSAPPVTWSPPAPQVAPPSGGGQTLQPAPLPQSSIQRWFAGTPGRMRALLIVSAVVTVLFGFAASQGFRQSDGALKRAEENTAQLVRIQAIHTNLVSANADATNAFLVGGLEPPAQRQSFVESMTTAAKLISQASTAQPADQEALGALNTTLLTYQGLIEQARANNRQGLPIGAQYLKDANAVLQTDSLPLLNALVTANEKRVDTEFKAVGGGNTWLLLGGLATLLVLAYTMWWLAKRTHRYLNFPITAAAVLVLLTILVGSSALSGASNSAKDTMDHSYKDTVALARARIAAYDAKSNESLTLIARGSGESYEKAWGESAATVGKNLAISTARQPQVPWTRYTNVHREIRELDTVGRWDEAVQLAVGSGANTSTGLFSQFEATSSSSLARISSEARGELTAAREDLPPIGWLGIPIGIVAALLVGWGLSQRLEEYR